MSIATEEKTKTAAVNPEQVAIALQHAIGGIADLLVARAEKLADEYDIASKKSPLRNVLNVSTSPSASPKVVENFIAYQAGKAGQNDIWRKKASNTTFAESLCTEIKGLEAELQAVRCRVKELIHYDLDLHEEKTLRMRLIQLFLGYLVRYHVARSVRNQ